MVQRRWFQLAAVILVVATGAAVLHARQGQPPAALPDGSLAALTAEVRALRIVIEDAAKTQVQVQGIGAYLGAQKDRILQASGRLDAARKDTLAAAEQVRVGAQVIVQLENALATPNLRPEQREDYLNGVRVRKAELERLKQAETEVRNRETLAEQDVQTEQMRWNELVARLEQVIRK